VSARFEFIDAQKAHYPVTKMCAWAGVSRSGYYEWAARPASATARRRERLGLLVAAIFELSDGTYGYRRVHAQLARQGEACSPELVRALMRDLGLVPCQPRPWRVLTEQAAERPATPDLVGRDFTATEPGTKLVGDVSYVRTWQGWLYLATVIDCFNSEVIGYAMADHYRTGLVAEAIEMAARNHMLASGCIFHSDRGSNYTSDEYARKLTELGLRQSLGRTGICYDNAMAESFFGTLKNERVHRTVYPTRKKARDDIARYIELFYNRQRLHSRLGYRSPHEVRVEYLNQQSAA
jgi:putative transposase